jgi:predicted Zn-dependent protease
VEEDLRAAIALSPDFSPSYALLGLYLALRTPHPEEGLTLVKKALSFDPSNSAYQLKLARVLLQMNRYKDASAAAAHASALARDAAEKSDVQEFNSYLERERQNNQQSGTPK